MAKKRLALAVLLGLSLLAACARLTATPTPPTPLPMVTPTPVPVPFRFPLEVQVTTAQAVYLPGEPVAIRIRFTNVGSEPGAVEPFPPALEVRRPRPNQTIWSSQEGTGKKSLSFGETASAIITWDQRDSTGQIVPSGYYSLVVKNVRFAQFLISESIQGRFLIQFPEGAEEKTVEPGQAQTRSGVTITLKRVELSPLGAKVYALAQPPGYTQPTTPGPDEIPLPQPTPPPAMYPVPAQYSLNGDPWLDAGHAGFTWLDEGVWLFWDLIDPIPNGTKEMKFVIGSFGSLPGPWEYRISL